LQNCWGIDAQRIHIEKSIHAEKSITEDFGMTAPEQIGQQFACEEGIDLNETFGGTVPSQRQADALRMEMPEVGTAYHPSGELPTTALLLLLLGSVVGCVGGAIAGALIASAGLALSAVLFPALRDIAGLVHIVCFGIPFIALALAFAVTGLVSALCTTQFGQWGRNRNIAAAVWLAALASTVPVIALAAYYRPLDKLFTDGGLPPFLNSPFLWLWLSLPFFIVSSLVGLVLASAVAGFCAAYRVAAVKFCESCQSTMGSCSKTLSLGRLRALVRALRKGRMDVVESLLHGPPGWEGKVHLYSCAACSCGYLEVTAQHQARSEGGGPYGSHPIELTNSWLVVSCELNASDVERVRSLLERG
jgi:hypothetical protein